MGAPRASACCTRESSLFAASSGLVVPADGFADCCAWAPIGHATAAPPSRLMNSRRLIGLIPAPRTPVLPQCCRRRCAGRERAGGGVAAGPVGSLRDLSLQPDLASPVVRPGSGAPHMD